jgi:flavodoxin
MKTLIVYDSNFGNTKIVAEEISKIIGGNLISVEDFKNTDLAGIELLIVGSPINSWKPTPAIIDFLKTLNSGELHGLMVSSFDTRTKLFSGDAKNKIAEELNAKGAELINSPGSFYVKGTKGPLAEGELEKAVEWAKKIIENSDSNFSNIESDQ